MKNLVLLLVLFFSFNTYSQFVENDSTFNTIDTGFGRGDGPNSDVNVTLCQPDGKILIGGEFTSYNGIPQNRITRLLPNGALDTSFNVGLGADGIVTSLLLQPNGKIIVGGSFYNYNGLTANHILRLNTDGTRDTTFTAGIIANAGITDMVLRPNGKIIIVGQFALPLGPNNLQIAQLNTNGSYDWTYANGFFTNSSILTAQLQTDGKVILGGTFTSVNTFSRNRIVRLDALGSIDLSFNPGLGADGTVYSIDIQSDGKILIAGSFSNYDTTSISCIARLNSNGSLDTSFLSNLTVPAFGTFIWNGFASLVIQSDGKIVFGGPANIPSDTVNPLKIIRLQSNGLIDTTFQISAALSGIFRSKITLQPDGKILFAGSLIDVNDTLVNNIGRINTDGTLDYFNLPNGTGANGSYSGWGSSWFWNYNQIHINSIALQPDGKILIGGSFGYFNGISKNRIARLHPDGSLDTTFKTRINGDLSSINEIILQPDGKILAGGNFQSVNGVAYNNLVRLLTNGTIDTSFQNSYSLGIVSSISLQTDGKIIIGQFSSVSNTVVRLHVNGTFDTTFNSNISVFSWANIFDTEIQPDGKILVCGQLQTSTSGTNYPNIARLNTDGSADVNFTPGLGADNVISDLILQPDGKVIILGVFSSFDGVPRNSLARLNPNGTLELSFDPYVGTTTWLPLECGALQADGKIIVGGGNYTFWSSFGLLDRINTNGTIDTTFSTGPGFDRTIYSLAIQPDGKIVVGGDFVEYNGIGRNRIARVISELPDATVSLDSLSGQDICENRTLNVSFSIKNINGSGVLPFGTPVSFFANDSVYISTVFTTDSISIGDSLMMSAVISIPLSVSSPFTLSIIANQDSSQLGIVGELVITNNTAYTTITLNEIFTPTFDSIAPVCQGTNVVLPTTSTNGVVGTWSPAFNNQATTTYLFIPSDTNCIDSVQLTVQIVPSTLPTFTLEDSICVSGTLVFPTVSNNAITGTWSPSFDNQNSATYTFLPDSLNVVSEGCPISTQHAVVIVPQTVPSFSFADSLCIGASFVLPTYSDNGILGTWSTPFNNLITTSYTFSPSSISVFNGCASTVNQTITIIPTLTPTFTIADSMCADVIYSLPTNSNENVLGSWSPVFDNQATQTYSFTSNSSGIVNTNVGFRCPLSASQTLTIVPRTTPSFTILDSTCVGASLVLPPTSDNSIVGTWSPTFNNQITTTYTFVPTTISVATSCPESVQKMVVVDPFVDPIFTSIDSICQGNIVVLPTTSENFINGSWSPVFDNQTTTTYTFTPSDPGCISSAQMTVPVFPLITPSFSIADSICQGDTLVFPTVSDNSISGTWAPAFDNQNTTTYTFTPAVTECAVATQLTVQVAPRITPIFSLPDTICQSDVLALPTVSDNNISGTWTPSFNNQQTTNYTFVRNVYECANDFNYTIVVMPTSITFDTLIYCENDLPFTWNGQTLTTSTNTTATLQDQYGCDSVVNFSFQVLPIQFSSFNEVICANETPFTWSGQTYNQSGSFVRTFIAQNGCDSIVTLNLIVNPAPIVDFSVLAWSGCLPLEIDFVNNQIQMNTSYVWNFGNGKLSYGSSQASTLYNQAGCYDIVLTATNQFGCIENLTKINAVCIDPNPIATFLPQNNPLPLVNPTTLLQNNSVDAYTYFWDFGDGNQDNSNYSPTHTFPDQAGSYLVTLLIENENGCPDSSTQMIVVEQDPLFYVPNAFTPDGNEFNNVFKAVFADNLVLSQFEMTIYNRWGELVFFSEDPQVGWEGSFDGKQAQDGVYTYRILFKEKGFSKGFQEVGSVVLVR